MRIGLAMAVLTPTFIHTSWGRWGFYSPIEFHPFFSKAYIMRHMETFKCLRHILHCERLSSISVLLISSSYDTSCKRIKANKILNRGENFVAVAMRCAIKEMHYVSGTLRSTNVVFVIEIYFIFAYAIWNCAKLAVRKTFSAEAEGKRHQATESGCCEWVEPTNGTIVHFSLLNQTQCGVWTGYLAEYWVLFQVLFMCLLIRIYPPNFPIRKPKKKNMVNFELPFLTADCPFLERDVNGVDVIANVSN